MPNSHCSVRNCPSTKKTNPNILFHPFPHPNEKIKYNSKIGNTGICNRRYVWALKLGINKSITPNSKVCSLHFTKHDYKYSDVPSSHQNKLRWNAVPSRHLPSKGGIDESKQMTNTISSADQVKERSTLPVFANIEADNSSRNEPKRMKTMRKLEERNIPSDNEIGYEEIENEDSRSKSTQREFSPFEPEIIKSNEELNKLPTSPFPAVTGGIEIKNLDESTFSCNRLNHLMKSAIFAVELMSQKLDEADEFVRNDIAEALDEENKNIFHRNLTNEPYIRMNSKAAGIENMIKDTRKMLLATNKETVSSFNNSFNPVTHNLMGENIRLKEELRGLRRRLSALEKQLNIPAT